MRQIVSGTSDNYMAALTDMFTDISNLLSQVGLGEQSKTYDTLITHIKSTMSDRHIVEKKVSGMFTNLRNYCFLRLNENF